MILGGIESRRELSKGIDDKVTQGHIGTGSPKLSRNLTANSAVGAREDKRLSCEISYGELLFDGSINVARDCPESGNVLHYTCLERCKNNN